MGEVARRLKKFLDRAANLPTEFDPEWTSPCIVGEPDAEGYVRWQPVPMDPPADFSDVEVQTGVQLRPEVKELLGSYWGWKALGKHSGQSVSITVAWNERDLERMKRGMMEHLKNCDPAAPTVFFANTDSDLFFSVDNNTGEVMLEEPFGPREVVAPSLVQFLTEA